MFPSEVRSLVNLFKGCGCGQRPQIVSFYEGLTAKRLAVWRLEHNGDSLLIAKARISQKDYSL